MIMLIDRYRFFVLFIILILFTLFKSLHAELGWFESIDTVFAVLIAATVLIIGHREKLTIILLAALIIIELGKYFLTGYVSQDQIIIIRFSFIILYFILMTFLCLRFTFEDKYIDITTIFGSLSAYLLIGFTFAYLFLLINVLFPGSFSGLHPIHEETAIYFSMITMTTVGYGEILPIKPFAQNLVWLESYFGQCYLAVLIGNLVGRYIKG